MTAATQHEEMKRYLFREMPEAEREAFEERFFEDSDYFYELVELENDLVDRYARGKISGEDLKRFEKSLALSPERREKVANARALQALIAEEKPDFAPAPTFRERLAGLFTLKMPALQYATGALAILLSCTTGFLLYQNRQARQEFARQQNERQNQLAERERALQEQIAQLENLKREFESERGQNEILSEKIEEIENQRLRLERQLSEIRQKNNPNPGKITPPQTTIASFFLLPGGGRGGAATKNISVSPGVTRLSFSLEIPKESTAETFSVKFKGSVVASNLKPRKLPSGRRILNINLPAQNLAEGEQTLTITGNDGREDVYPFILRKK